MRGTGTGEDNDHSVVSCSGLLTVPQKMDSGVRCQIISGTSSLDCPGKGS